MKALKDFFKGRTFIFFVIAVLALTAQLFLLSKAVMVNWNYLCNDVPYKVYSLLTALADAVAILLIYWLLPRWRAAAAIIVTVAMAVWSLIQMLYLPTYHDIMPWNAFTYVGNVSSVLIKSAVGELRASHALLAAVPLLLLVLYLAFFKRSMRKEKVGGRMRLTMALACVLTYVAVRGALLFYPFPVLKDTCDSAIRFRGYAQLMGSHNRYYMKYGFVAYTTRSAIYSIITSKHLSDDERQQIEQFLAANPHYTDNAYGQTGKNLILIVVESLNAWVVDLTIDGRPVTPVLNSLCADSTALVALHMKTQVKNGHSSDGHFMYNTGLLPLTSESVAMNYGNRDYPSLAKALKGYDSFEVVCDYVSMWNQQETYRSYGFDRIYSFPDMEPLLEQCDYVVDRVLMRQSVGHMQRARQPFYAQLVTLNMHSPYDELQYVKPGWISASGAFTGPVRNYLEVTASFDKALGGFIADLKAAGLYDNSIIVIVSDHTERVDDDPHGRPSLSPEGDDCVFVALNTGHGRRVNEIMGQIDVYPTILDLMGANHYRWKGLGRSVMRGGVGAAAITPEVVKGKAGAGQQERMQQAWQISDLMITRNYFSKNK